MAGESEIGVNLRLKMDNLAKDSTVAGQSINRTLASSVKGLSKTTIEREDEAAAARAFRTAVINRRKLRAIEEQYDRQNSAKQGGRGFPIAPILAGLGAGIPGAGAIASLSVLNPTTAAVVIAFRGLIGAIHMTTRAAEDARRMYAKTLQSGFGMQFTTNRSLLANAIGVGENEVYQYGAAVAVLNEKFKYASKTLSETNPVLTMTSWKLSVVKADFQAFTSTIAVQFAGMIQKMADAMHPSGGKGLFEEIGDSVSESIKRMKAEAFSGTYGIGTAIERNKSGVETGFHFTNADGSPMDAKKQKQVNKLFNRQKNMQGAESAPLPVAFMKQMPASAWEHMGLVVGSGGGVNYGKNTADNTKRAADALALLPANIAAAFRNYAAHNPNGVSIPSM